MVSPALAGQRWALRAQRQVPDARSPVQARRCQAVFVGIERDRGNGGAAAGRHKDTLVLHQCEILGDLKKLQVSILSANREHSAICTERERPWFNLLDSAIFFFVAVSHIVSASRPSLAHLPFGLKAAT